MKKSVSIRIEESLLGKVRFVAEKGNRSINGYILHLIRKDIETFKKEHSFPDNGIGYLR